MVNGYPESVIEKERSIRLEKLIDESRKKRINAALKYDVLVPLSGGRDSSYVAYVLSKKMNLKVLCVHYDNPFSSKQAAKNIKVLVEHLGLDLITFKWPNKRHERSFVNNLKAWLKKPDLASMGFFA